MIKSSYVVEFIWFEKNRSDARCWGVWFLFLAWRMQLGSARKKKKISIFYHTTPTMRARRCAITITTTTIPPIRSACLLYRIPRCSLVVRPSLSSQNPNLQVSIPPRASAQSVSQVYPRRPRKLNSGTPLVQKTARLKEAFKSKNEYENEKADEREKVRSHETLSNVVISLVNSRKEQKRSE